MYYTARLYGKFDDMGKYVRYNLYMISVYAFLMLISRLYIRQTRSNFLSRHRQERLLHLFQNLVKLYHDGIIIATKDDILFQNQKVMEIFDIKPMFAQPNNSESIGTGRGLLNNEGRAGHLNYSHRKLSSINQEDSSKKVI